MDTKVKFFDLKDLSEVVQLAADEKVIMCDGLTSLDVLNLYFDHSVQHILQKSNTNYENEYKLCLNTQNNPDIFFKYPLSVILGEMHPTQDTENQKTQFSHFLSMPTDRDLILERIEELLLQSGRRKSLVGDICLAADELITNAIFNAPYTDSQNQNRNVERNYSKIQIDPDKKPHFFVSTDEVRTVIGCTDYYGRLDVSGLLERIKHCYVNDPGERINFRGGGAGIGSFLIFDLCSSYYIAVNPEKSTTICCTFPSNMTPKQRNETPKNVHIILNS